MNGAHLPKLGIIAGGGHAPRQVMAACEAAGRPYVLFCLEGQADPDLPGDKPHLWLGFGAVGKLKDACAGEGIEEIVMIGRVRRPSFFEIKPDWLGIRVLAKIGLHSLGDDGLLRALGKALEEACCVRVIGAQDVAGGLLTPKGVLTRTQPDGQARFDIARGFEIAETLGRLDIGQAVVMQQGLVLGLEAIEGTDALIVRAGRLKRQGGGGVLVKRSKPQQDERLDLPAIGPGTVESLAKAGLMGVAVEAGRSLLIDRARTIEVADEEGLFIVGWTTLEVEGKEN